MMTMIYKLAFPPCAMCRSTRSYFGIGHPCDGFLQAGSTDRIHGHHHRVRIGPSQRRSKVAHVVVGIPRVRITPDQDVGGMTEFPDGKVDPAALKAFWIVNEIDSTIFSAHPADDIRGSVRASPISDNYLSLAVWQVF
jgi:hypothetical protein